MSLEAADGNLPLIALVRANARLAAAVAAAYAGLVR